jgi:hypothetical protein
MVTWVAINVYPNLLATPHLDHDRMIAGGAYDKQMLQKTNRSRYQCTRVNMLENAGTVAERLVVLAVRCVDPREAAAGARAQASRGPPTRDWATPQLAACTSSHAEIALLRLERHCSNCHLGIYYHR